MFQRSLGAESSPHTRVINAKDGIAGRLRSKASELVRYRELLPNLIRKELKLRYKNSVLGFAWSMLNPLMYLVVFYVVFNFFLAQRIPNFHVYFLSGLVAWTLFSAALVQATGSVVGNSELVRKVYFPREMLPLSSIGAASIHFFFQLFVLVTFLLITRYEFAGTAALLVPTALVAELLLLAGLSLILAAVNVKARDVQYLVELGLLAWFWMTPVVYPSAPISDALAARTVGPISLVSIYLANPMARVVIAFQRGIYGQATRTLRGETFPVIIDQDLSWYFKGLGYVALLAIALIAAGAWIFHRLDSSFAEEL